MDSAPILSVAPAGLRLDLACGVRPRDGFEGVDIRGDVAVHRVDLFRFPFPWADDSVEELSCCHFVEHLPARFVEANDVDAGGEHIVGQDYFLAFFDECYRVLRPEGKMKVIVPSSKSDRGFQDPTHRRYLNQNSFCYLNAKMREELDVAHYAVRCDFDFVCIPIGPVDFALLCDEVRVRRFNESWNAVLDWDVSLTSRKCPKEGNGR